MRSIYFLAAVIFFTAQTANAQVVYTATVPAGTNTCFITGEMTGWSPVEMTKQNATEYSISIPGATVSQKYIYMSGPAWNFSESTIINGGQPYRTYNPADVVTGWRLIWNFTNNFAPAVSSGTVQRIWFNSNIVDDRYIDVWLPNGYTAGLKYNVLYMQDGQNLFDAAATFNGHEWNVDGTLGTMLSNGLIDQTIVVGIHNNGTKQNSEYFPEKVINAIAEPLKTQLLQTFGGATPKADDYLKFVVTELKPYIDLNFSTDPSQGHCFIGGSNMGALAALYAFCEYPGIFSRAACLSTNWLGTQFNNTQIPAAINSYLTQYIPPVENRKIYFDHGTVGLDGFYAAYQTSVNALFTSKGYGATRLMSQVFVGANHDETSWNTRFNIPAQFILSGTSFITGVNGPVDQKLSLNAYPNPFVKDLFVEIESSKQKQAIIRINDVTGKEVYVRDIQLRQGKNLLNIGDANLPSKAIYFVTISSSDGMRQFKINKQ